jgi:hypothetical protein
MKEFDQHSPALMSLRQAWSKQLQRMREFARTRNLPQMREQRKALAEAIVRELQSIEEHDGVSLFEHILDQAVRQDDQLDRERRPGEAKTTT